MNEQCFDFSSIDTIDFPFVLFFHCFYFYSIAVFGVAFWYELSATDVKKVYALKTRTHVWHQHEFLLGVCVECI